MSVLDRNVGTTWLARDPGRRFDPFVAVLLLTVGVFALRVSQMGQGLYGDEVTTYHDIVGHGLGSMIRAVYTGSENSPPLFFILAWFSAKLGDPSIWIRLPSLLLGVGTIPLLYAVGRETFNARIGPLAGAVLGLSPFSLYYGIEARSYAAMGFFVVLSTWAVLHATRTRDWRSWLLYALAVACAAYAHYTSVFALAAQGAWALWACSHRLREPLLAGGLAVLLYLPWLAHVRGKFVQVIGVLHPLTASNVIVDLGRLFPGYPDATLAQLPTLPALVAFLACAAAGGIWWLRRVLARPASPLVQAAAHPTIVLIVLIAVATPVGLLLYSLLGTDLWLARGLYASVPYACLVLAAALMALPRYSRSVAAAIVLATLTFGAIRAVSPSYARPQYQQVASYLDRAAGPRDPVIAVGLLPSGLSAYLHKPHPVFNLNFPWRTVPTDGTVWLLIERDVLSRFLHLKGPQLPGFSLIMRRHYSGIASITVLAYHRS